MSPKVYNPSAFLDQGYPSGYPFCEKFLSSGEFTVDFLTQFEVYNSSDQKNKVGYASNVARALQEKKLDPNTFLLSYFKKSRTWLSFKEGQYLNAPQFEHPEQLLTSLGEAGWYGPVKDDSSSKLWYLRTYHVPHRLPVVSELEAQESNGSNADRVTFETKMIRWPIIVELSEKYIALHWDGFSHTDEGSRSHNQFPYWQHIPKIFEEIEQHLGGTWKHPELHKLLLYELWEKFNHNKENPQYLWSHKRVRAHSSGIALNAHSSSDSETDPEDVGLKALSRKLAEAVLEAQGHKYPYAASELSKAENAILNTLIREWGTKSYEFTLKQAKLKTSHTETHQAEEHSNEAILYSFPETIFRVHCYFGLNQSSKTPDALQHLKCYKDSGYSSGVLESLLAELGIEGTPWPNSSVSQN